MVELAFTDHLSYSQLNEFLMCGEHYKRHRVTGTIPPNGLGAAAGRAFHTAIAEYFKAAIHNDIPDEALIKRMYQETWLDSPWQKLMPAVTQSDWQTAYDRMHPMARATFEKYNMIIDPREVEKEFRIEVGKMPMLGFMDMITKQGDLIDWKTGARVPPDNAAETSQQLTLYDYAYRNLFGKPPNSLIIIYVKQNKKGEYQYKECYSEPRKDEAFERLEIRMRLLEQALANNGPWLPASENHWKCSAKQCSYYETCKVRA